MRLGPVTTFLGPRLPQRAEPGSARAGFGLGEVGQGWGVWDDGSGQCLCLAVSGTLESWHVRIRKMDKPCNVLGVLVVLVAAALVTRLPETPWDGTTAQQRPALRTAAADMEIEERPAADFEPSEPELDDAPPADFEAAQPEVEPPPSADFEPSEPEIEPPRLPTLSRPSRRSKRLKSEGRHVEGSLKYTHGSSRDTCNIGHGFKGS